MIPDLMADIAEGGKLCWRVGPIRWRLVFLALETALEDSMVAVIVAEFALSSPLFGDQDAVMANVWTACIIAAGKVGAIISGVAMAHFWSAPRTRAGYRPLFVLVLIGSTATLLLPLAHEIAVSNGNDPDSRAGTTARVLVFVSAFLFFLCSTAPKIGT